MIKLTYNHRVMPYTLGRSLRGGHSYSANLGYGRSAHTLRHNLCDVCIAGDFFARWLKNHLAEGGEMPTHLELRFAKGSSQRYPIEEFEY